MKMTIQQLMQDMNMSRYRSSKISGIPWATLAAIYSEKTHLDRCVYLFSENPDCTEALKRISARVDMKKIKVLIEEPPTLLPVQKEFYMAMISERKAKTLDYSMEQLIRLDRQEPVQKNLGQQFSM
jgi:hypothetical protein